MSPFLPSSLPPFFPSSLPPFLPSSLPPFLPSSLPPFLPSSLPPFLPSSLPLSLLPSLPLFLPPSLPPSLPYSLPLSLHPPLTPLRSHPPSTPVLHHYYRFDLCPNLPPPLFPFLVVRISGADVMGFVVHARDDHDTVVGSFSDLPPLTATITCRTEADTWSHSDTSLKTNPQAQWAPPPHFTGTVHFR